MARTLEPGRDWPRAISAARMILDVTDALEGAVVAALAGLERRDVDDIDKLIQTTEQRLGVIKAQTKKARERYGWTA